MKLSRAVAMLRQKGVRLVYTNVKERILFDFLNGIDTITQLPKSEFKVQPDSFAHGVHYSSSWTSEIKFGFHAVRRLLQAEFGDYAFIDVGCGKGKVQIVWRQMLDRYKISQAVYGLDYYDALLDQARANFRKAIGEDGHFLHADATRFDYGSIGEKLILYLYNPFDDVVLRAMVEALRSTSVVLIYNNPEHAGVLADTGFTVVAEKRGFHPQGVTIVYRRPSC